MAIEVELTEEAWGRALTSATDTLETHFRQGGLSTKDARRAAMDDALQHAVGIILLECVKDMNTWPDEIRREHGIKV